MVAELNEKKVNLGSSCSLAKISMVAEPYLTAFSAHHSCSLAKISMVAELF